MLVAGVVTMLVLFQFDEPPAEASTAGLERQLTVHVALMHPEDHPVTIHGYGSFDLRESSRWRQKSLV